MIEIKRPNLSLNERSEFGQWKYAFLGKRKNELNEIHYANILAIARHTAPIDAMPMEEIMPQHIDYLLTVLVKNLINGNPLAKKTLKNIRDFIASVYNYAIENSIAIHNPALRRTIVSGTPPKKRRALSSLEERLVHQYQEHAVSAAALTMLYTGLRRGELLALKWSNVHFDRKMITVDSSVYCEHGKFYLKSGAKTACGVRVIPLPDNLSKLLEHLKLSSNSVFVFARRNGEMHTGNSWKRAWESYLTYLNHCYYNEKTGENRSLFHPGGLERRIQFTAHILRHTYATLLYKAAVRVKDAQHWFGHANVTTTLDIYTHIERDIIDQQASEQLNCYIKKIPFFS